MFDAKHIILSHLPWIVLAGSAFVGFEYWKSEHDARLLAVQEQKVSDAHVQSLQQAVADRDKLAAQQVAPIVKIVHDTQTVPQAVNSFPDVMTQPLPLSPAPLNGGIFFPAPDVIPLFQQVADDKVCRVQLDTATKDLTDTRSTVKERETEIAELKKPTKFWTRTKQFAKVVGIGIGIGFVLGKKF